MPLARVIPAGSETSAKRPVALVPVERVPAAREPGRPARDRHSLVATQARLRRRVAVELDVDVVGGEEVEPAVAVVVDEGAARSPARARAAQTGLDGHVLEAPVALVPVEVVLSPVRDVQVDVSVVVVVAGAGALPPPALGEAGLLRDVGEAAVAAIPVEVIRRLRPARESLERRAVDQEHVLPAVAVVVEEGDAAARRLEQVLVLLAAPVDRERVEAGLPGGILEREAERGLGIRRGRGVSPCDHEREHEQCAGEGTRACRHGCLASGGVRCGASRWAFANSAWASAWTPVASSASASW